MSNTIAYVDNQTLVNIANAVRTKTDTNGKMLLSDIPDKIRNIDGIVPIGTQTITENGVYDVTEKAEVNVDVNPDLRPLSVSENGTYEPDGFDGYSGVEVNVEQLGVLIKTETLDHNEAQDQGDPFFWYRYFNLGAGIFFLFFDNNGYLDTAYKNRAVDMICFVTSPDAGTKALVMSRNGYTDPRSNDNSWSWASAGTTIRVYQIPYNLTHDA